MEQGDSVCVFTDPDYETPGTGQVLRNHLAGDPKLDEVTARLIFAAGRRQKQRELIEKLQEGYTVLSDRYAHSGVACGLAKARTAQLQKRAVPAELGQEWLEDLDRGLVSPDLVIYFQIRPEIAASRGGDYGRQLYERQDFQEALRGVLDENVARWSLTPILAERAEEEVTNEILALVRAIVPPKARAPMFEAECMSKRDERNDQASRALWYRALELVCGWRGC